MKSWLRFNLRQVGEIRVKVPRLNETPTIAGEVVPAKEELARQFSFRVFGPKPVCEGWRPKCIRTILPIHPPILDIRYCLTLQ